MISYGLFYFIAKSIENISEEILTQKKVIINHLSQYVLTQITKICLQSNHKISVMVIIRIHIKRNLDFFSLSFVLFWI